MNTPQDPLVQAVSDASERAADIARGAPNVFSLSAELAKAVRFSVACNALAIIIAENSGGDLDDALANIKLAAETVADATTVQLGRLTLAFTQPAGEA